MGRLLGFHFRGEPPGRGQIRLISACSAIGKFLTRVKCVIPILIWIILIPSTR